MYPGGHQRLAVLFTSSLLRIRRNSEVGGALTVAVLSAGIEAVRYVVVYLHAGVYSTAASGAPGWQGSEVAGTHADGD